MVPKMLSRPLVTPTKGTVKPQINQPPPLMTEIARVHHVLTLAHEASRLLLSCH